MIRLKQLLFEQNDKSYIDKVYLNMISSISGPGTDPDTILKIIQSLTATQCFGLFQRFKDGRTGYRSFTEMVNKEYKRKH